MSIHLLFVKIRYILEIDGTGVRFFCSLYRRHREFNSTLYCDLWSFKKLLLECTEEKALELSAQLHQGKVVELTDNLAINAAKISMEYSLPMADSIVYTTAKYYNAKLYTQDEDFSKIEDVGYIEK